MNREKNYINDEEFEKNSAPFYDNFNEFIRRKKR